MLLVNRFPQPAILGQKKGRHFERLPNSERRANGEKITQSLLLRRKGRWTKLPQHTGGRKRNGAGMEQKSRRSFLIEP